MSNDTIGFDERVRALLHDAAEWRLLGRLLECPSPGWHAEVAALGGEVTLEPLRIASEQARDEASEGLYHALCGPGGPAPPREATYHQSVELGTLLSEIAGEYAAFGYDPKTNEPLDHIAVETGFLAYLRLKEAFARAKKDDEAAETTNRAARRFVADHLSKMAGTFAELVSHSGVEYLTAASSLLAARMPPKPASKQLPMVQPDPFVNDDEGFACRG
jgi:TorA maturation chaperone TorD